MGIFPIFQLKKDLFGIGNVDYFLQMYNTFLFTFSSIFSLLIDIFNLENIS